MSVQAQDRGVRYPAAGLTDARRRGLRLLAGRVLALAMAANIAAMIWLWAQGGGISSVNSLAALLTSGGRITGLLGADLLLVQILLMARLPFLEWAAGFDRLAAWHRVNGRLCLLLILAHIGLITAGYAITDKISITAEISSMVGTYPGMIAATAGSVLIVMVAVTSMVIVRRKMRYETWYLVHLMAYGGIFLSWFHQIPDGNEFVTNPMAAALWTALYVATLQLVVLFRFAQPIVRTFWHRMRVAEVVKEGPGVVSLRITGHHLDWLNAKAGQFFLWRFLANGRWWESHPFSLSAAPDGDSLRITVKNLGDFTGRIAEIKPGTMVVAEGPFGAFTDAVRTRDRVALIAGGIGITPIRALLEEMHGDLVLIYRAVSEDDLVFQDELDRLARSRGITIHYVLGDHRAPGNGFLMSTPHLKQLMPDIAEREIYLCGPRPMMQILQRNVRRAGVPSAFIHTDQFAL